NPCNHHALGLVVLGPEHLLAVNLVIGDCLLAFVRNEPVDELLAKLLLHMRMLGRINQDDTVLVEQQFVALYRYDEVGLVLERNPSAAVRHHIGSAGCCYVERGTHALPDRFVPRPTLLLDVDADILPEIDFRNMRTGVVAARDEGCALGFNGLQRKGDVPCPLDAGGIVLRSDDDKIVVHHGIALHAKPFRNEFLFCLPGMHENHVGIAAARGVERLAGTLCDDFNIDAGLGLEQRQDVAEQPGVLRRSGGGDHDGLVPRAHGPGDDEGNGRGQDEQASAGRHGALLFMFLYRGWATAQTSSSPRMNRRASSVLGSAKNVSAAPLSITRPRCRSTIAPATRLAWPRSCVDITTLIPRAATTRTTSSIAFVAAGSRLAVGSSSRRICGSLARARASASRCCSPPESFRAGRPPRPARPTTAASSSTREARFARGTPAAVSA